MQPLSDILAEALSKLEKPDVIRQWLKSKASAEIVGYTCLSSRCLLAEFLRQTGVIKAPITVEIGNLFDLSNIKVKDLETAEDSDLPEFARYYAELLDAQVIDYLDCPEDEEALKKLYPNFPSVPITAQIALLLLEHALNKE